jgi:peptidoglycan/xylan/chitin deacetylase (PgdA/CDA1 family)
MTDSIYRRIRPFIARCLYYSGLVPLVRGWTRYRGPRVIILNYHRATGGDLRRHLAYLNRHYRIMSLEKALEELYASGPRARARQVMDRRTPLVLTFDDGYADNYTEAAALARELHVPITIFLIPGYIGGSTRFVWQEAEYLVRHAQVSEAVIEGRRYRLDHQKERAALLKEIDSRSRFASSVAERDAFLTRARQALGVADGTTSEEPLAQPLTWPQVHEMEAAGWVTYGAHTMYHPVLACLADTAEVWQEVEQSRIALERAVQHEVRAFAYPYGKPWDIGQPALEAVRAAGFNWAATTTPGSNTPSTDPHLLCRVPTDVTESWVILAVQAAGVWWTLWDMLTRAGRPATQVRKLAGTLRRPPHAREAVTA